jgi:hypothetical protein
MGNSGAWSKTYKNRKKANRNHSDRAFWLVPFPLFWLVDERSIEVFVFCPFKNGMVNVPKLPCIRGILLPHLTREGK